MLNQMKIEKRLIYQEWTQPTSIKSSSNLLLSLKILNPCPSSFIFFIHNYSDLKHPHYALGHGFQQALSSPSFSSHWTSTLHEGKMQLLPKARTPLPKPMNMPNSPKTKRSLGRHPNQSHHPKDIATLSPAYTQQPPLPYQSLFSQGSVSNGSTGYFF